jgi:rhodanese-related sulfurtransferase
MGATATSVSSADLRRRLDSDAPPQLLDVRSPAEFEAFHIPGAYNVPIDLVRERRLEIVDKLSGDVVFVCRSGQRAKQAADVLGGAGLAHGSVLDGGILSWEGSGFDVHRGAQKWDIERQVRLVAGSIVLTSVLGSVAAPKLKWLAAAIGGGLTFAAVSNTCAMGTALSKLPYNRSSGYDPAALVSRLGSDGADHHRTSADPH